jgi:Mor family transcriptional regulator
MTERPAASRPAALAAVKPWLPALLRDIWDIFGEGAARRLMRHFAGIEVWVPKKVGPDHRLSRSLGFHVAVWLTRNYGGCAIAVPTGGHLRQIERDMLAFEMRGKGQSVRHLARRLKVRDRTIYRMLKRARERLAAADPPARAERKEKTG